MCARCSLKVVAIKAPGFGERKSSYLEDIATLTGGQVVKDEVGLQVDKVRLISASARGPWIMNLGPWWWAEPLTAAPSPYVPG